MKNRLHADRRQRDGERQFLPEHCHAQIRHALVLIHQSARDDGPFAEGGAVLVIGFARAG
jgi:hypothetical protein